MTMQFFRRLHRFFAGPCLQASAAFSRQTVAWKQTTLLVRFYYIALSYLAVSLLPSWDGLIHAPSFEPLWPVAWLRWVPSTTGIAAILSLYLFGSIAAALWPQFRLTRALAWLGLFQFVAFNNSFGKIGHSLHAMLLTGFVLIALPAIGKSPRRIERQSYLQVFWLAEVVFLLVYSMAGLGKVIGCLYQLKEGEMTVLNPHAFAYQVAGRLIQTNLDSSLGAWLIHYWWVGWPFYLSMIYIQFFAVWAAFRPALLRPWALALILFHVGSFFIFTILFAPNMLLIGIFLLANPAVRPWNFGPAFIESLPLIGPLWRRVFKKRAACAS